MPSEAKRSRRSSDLITDDDIWAMYQRGTPLVLLKIILIVRHLLVDRSLDFCEVFAGCQSIANGYAVFGCVTAAYDILYADAPP